MFALSSITEKLPADYPIPIVVVQHRSKDQKHLLEDVLQAKSALRIKQADEKEKIKNGFVYVAPPDYHLLIEQDKTFSLSSEDYVNFSRPSIDVLFESAALVYETSLIGIILTGSNKDGAFGAENIHKHNGLTIAQDPEEAQYPFMPSAAISTGKISLILTLSQISEFLLNIRHEQAR